MIIKDGKVALPESGELSEVDLRVEDGKIREIGKELSGEDEVIAARGLLVFPGGIDPHVHYDDPGFTDREDFYHGSAASASGGITTVIDMPCTSIPPVTDVGNLETKLAAIEGKAVIDYGLFGGVSPQSIAEGFPANMEDLAKHVLGFKTYFISVMELFGGLNHFQFKEVLERARDLGVVILLHAEDYSFVTAATERCRQEGKGPIDYYRSRPETAEILAVLSAVELAAEVGSELHVVHVSTSWAAELLATSPFTCETCPHYLQFDLVDFEKIGSPLKTTPPVKLPGNRDKLWELLASGGIDFVSSDHAPCPKEGKETGSIWTDYAGAPGSGTLLPYVFSEGYKKGRLTLKRFLEVVSEGAAKRYGIFDRKGSIEVGKDADFVLIDPAKTWKVEGEKFFSKGKITPFEGMELSGKIVKTIVRGKVVYDETGGIVGEKGFGEMLKKG